ncbi:MAG: phosphate ABC transporter permease family protein, partial [Methylohalobius sp.]
MQVSTLILMLLGLTACAYYLGLRRAIAVSGGPVRRLHSLPHYYGYYVALWCSLPAFCILGLWLALDDRIITQLVTAALPEEIRSLPPQQL